MWVLSRTRNQNKGFEGCEIGLPSTTKTVEGFGRCVSFVKRVCFCFVSGLDAAEGRARHTEWHRKALSWARTLNPERFPEPQALYPHHHEAMVFFKALGRRRLEERFDGIESFLGC